MYFSHSRTLFVLYVCFVVFCSSSLLSFSSTVYLLCVQHSVLRHVVLLNLLFNSIYKCYFFGSAIIIVLTVCEIKATDRIMNKHKNVIDSQNVVFFFFSFASTNDLLTFFKTGLSSIFSFQSSAIYSLVTTKHNSQFRTMAYEMLKHISKSILTAARYHRLIEISPEFALRSHAKEIFFICFLHIEFIITLLAYQWHDAQDDEFIIIQMV